jgi:hypothetical protein
LFQPREVGLRRYGVNLLVHHATLNHAPWSSRTTPLPAISWDGSKEAVFGALVTDFTMIRPGALHRANGGYLILNFDDLLMSPIRTTSSSGAAPAS